jgi:hypothetical protein
VRKASTFERPRDRIGLAEPPAFTAEESTRNFGGECRGRRLAGEALGPSSRVPLVGEAPVGLAHSCTYARWLPLWQLVEYVALPVHLAALQQRALAQHGRHHLRQCLAALDDHQQRARRVKAALDCQFQIPERLREVLLDPRRGCGSHPEQGRLCAGLRGVRAGDVGMDCEVDGLS